MAFFDAITGAIDDIYDFTIGGQLAGAAGDILDEAGEFIEGSLLGGDAADAAIEAAQLQQEAGQQASSLLDPFAVIGQQGLSQANFLTDPQAQVNFLQNNPLFQLGLDNLNQQTQNIAAARGRLSAGDTLQQLQNNALLASQPLIQQQKQSIGDLLNFGLTTAGQQGNLLTGQAAAGAGGIVGASNAKQQGVNNLLQLGGLLGGLIGG
jgi:hypothetical protein